MARLMEGREKDCCCYFARDRTKSTSLSLSASDTRGELGGIGTPPVTAVQLPLPPLCTFLTSTSFGEPFSTVPSVRVAEISFWPLYFSATSFQAGPTTFLSTEWQAKQPLFFARSNPSSAWAVPAGAAPRGAEGGAAGRPGAAGGRGARARAGRAARARGGRGGGGDGRR